MPVSVFISYAREDTAHLHALERHLALMRRQNILSAWHAELVVAGQDWGAEVEQRLLSAHIVILLVSSGYFSSDLAYTQMEVSIQRAREGKAIVIPILVRPCVLQGSRLNSLTKLPDNGEPVTAWSDIDAAWTNVASGIRRAIVALNGGKTVSPVTVYPNIPHPPVGGDHALASGGHAPASGAYAPVSGYMPVRSARAPVSSNSSSWAGQGHRAPRPPSGLGFFSWVWRGFALTMVAALFYGCWSVFRAFSPAGRADLAPTPQGVAVAQAAFVPLDWGPGSKACPTADPQIILGNCQRFKSLEWLRGELSKLQKKGVGCLPDLPASFTLQSGVDPRTGTRNFFLYLFDTAGTQRLANVWIKGGKLTVTDLVTRKKIVLAYDENGSWSAGPDEDHLKLVP